MNNYETNPRDYAVELVESGVISANAMLTACLKFMSHDDVRDMLDANELSPRFSEPQYSVSVTLEYVGYSDYWRGNGRRWGNNAGCLFAFYGKGTTWGDIISGWEEDFTIGGDCDSFPESIEWEQIEEAIKNVLLVPRDTICEFAEDCNVEEDDESPVCILLVEIEEE